MKYQPFTTEELLKIYPLFREGFRGRRIKEKLGLDRSPHSIFYAMKALGNHVNHKPTKSGRVLATYAEAARIINQESSDKPVSTWAHTGRTTAPEALVKAYQCLQRGLTNNEAARRAGIPLGSALWVARRLKERVALLPEINPAYYDNWKEALRIIRDGDTSKNGPGEAVVVHPVSPPPPEEYKPMSREITTELLLKIWNMKRESRSIRSIAGQLGWVTKGSTRRVGVILGTLEIYLSKHYDDIRNKQGPYKQARESILQGGYKQSSIGTYLFHDEETDQLRANVGIDWDTIDESLPESEPPTSQESLNEAFKNLRKSIKDYIVTEVKSQTRLSSLSEDIQDELVPQQLTPGHQETLMAIDDDGVKGYLLKDIETFLGEKYSVFIDWYAKSAKSGGMFNGGYYVQIKDFEEYLSH